jgi:UDP-glucose 4-epimerase
MKVLVTGGMGYIGGRLVQALELDEAYSPIVHGRLAPRDKPQSVFRLADFADLQSIEGLCEGVDSVVHLASLDEQVCAEKPVAALEVNVRGTYQLLQEAQRAGVQRFVYLSTFHVYGPSNGPHYHEKLVPAPLHHYGITRLMAEQYVRQAGAETGMNTVIARLSNGFGFPASHDIKRWGLVVNDLCLQAVRDEKLTLKTPGLQHRDFVPIGDVISALKLLLTGQLEYDIYHVGSGHSMSIREIAIAIRSIYQERYGAELVLMAPEPGVGQQVPIDFNLDRLKGLGFTASNDWAEEINRTFDLCREHMREIVI